MADRVYTAPPTVRRFMLDDSFFRTIVGPIGSGKSTGCVIEIIRRCKQQPVGADGFRRSRWAVVRNTRPQLKDTTLKTWLDWVPDGVAGRWKESDMSFLLEFGDVRAEILFRPLDSPADTQRVLSLELTGAWLNEAREIPKEIVEAIQGRLGRYPAAGTPGAGWYGLIADTNPPEIDSFWHRVLEGLPTEKDNPNSVFQCAAFKQPSGLSATAENRAYLPPDYYERLATGKTADWVNTYVHGMYSPSLYGKPVYQGSFIYGQHVSKTPLPIDASLPVIVGMDFGLTPAAVFKQYTNSGRIHTLRELTAFSMGLERFIDTAIQPLIRNLFPGMRLIFIGDPAGVRRADTDESDCFRVLKRVFGPEGHVVKPAPTNNPTVRIRATEKALVEFPQGIPRSIIDPSCERLVQGFLSKYRYLPSKRVDLSDSPTIDKNDWSHVMDASQYADLFILGGKYDPKDYRNTVAANFNPLNFSERTDSLRAPSYVGY